MANKGKRVNLTISHAFHEWLEREAKKRNITTSQLILDLAEPGAREQGYDGQVSYSWGTRNLDKLVEAVDALTDYGRNDPTA